MDVFSTELRIRLSFVKTSEFRAGGGGEHPNPPPRYATGADGWTNRHEEGNSRFSPLRESA
jgi:hypothetical protein